MRRPPTALAIALNHSTARLGAWRRTLGVCALPLLTIALSTACAAGPVGDEPTQITGDRFDRGELSVVNHIPVLRTEGSDYQRGVQHGHLLSTEIAGVLDGYLAAAIDGDYRRSREFYMVAAHEIAKFIDEPALDEMQGIAEGSGQSFDDVLLWNVWVDIAQTLLGRSGFAPPISCSAFAVVGSSTTLGTPLVGRTLDVGLRLHNVALPPTLVQVARPERGKPFTMITWPGMVGCHTATNLDGLVISVSPVVSLEGMTPAQPLWITMRRIAERCQNIATAQDMLFSTTLPIAANVLICDTQNQASVVECAGSTLAVRGPHVQDGVEWVGCANHFVEESMAERQSTVAPSNSTSLSRYQTMNATLTDSVNKFGILECTRLVDRIVNPMHTTLAIVIDPATGDLYLSVVEDAIDPSAPFRHVPGAATLGARAIR